MDAIIDLQRFSFSEAFSTTPIKINDHGDIVGSYVMKQGAAEQAFLYSASQRQFLPISIPNAVTSQARGVSEWKDGLAVCGWFQDASGKVHGFMARTDGAGNLKPASPIDVAIGGASRRILVGCDKDGRFMLGQYTAGNGETRGFLAVGSGPDSVHAMGESHTLPNGAANDFRWVVGTYIPSGPYGDGENRGFLYETDDYKAGRFSTIPPAAIEPDGLTESHAWDINETMTIVGEFWLDGKRLGFVYRNDKFTTFAHPNDRDGTALFGINNHAQVVGAYYANDVSYGFTAQVQHVPLWSRIPERIKAVFGLGHTEERRA